MRTGNFTSSEIVALTTNPTATSKKEGAIFGKPALTYIKQTNWERNLGRSIDSETTSRPLSWGKLCEVYVLQHMGMMQYTPLMDEPKQHPTIEYWWGSPDAMHEKENSVVELKCPQTLGSFCGLVEPLMIGLTGIEAINHIRDNHNDGEKYYWQMVSNAIITGKPKAELIVFCPYLDQLDELRMLAGNMPTDSLYQYYWIANSKDNELPYLNNDGKYSNVNRIVFDVPQADIDFLIDRVQKAGELLSK